MCAVQKALCTARSLTWSAHGDKLIAMLADTCIKQMIIAQLLPDKDMILFWLVHLAGVKLQVESPKLENEQPQKPSMCKSRLKSPDLRCES